MRLMRNKTKIAVACGAILLTAGLCAAQNDGAKASSEPDKYFHLDFAVKESEGGKVTSARHYTTTTSTGCSIRTGNKVPVPVSGTIGSSQFTYIDVGVNIDCRHATEINGSLALDVTAEISNAVTSSNPPLIRQTKWNSNVILPLGKATVLFSSDDVTTKGQMQLELTATLVK